MSEILQKIENALQEVEDQLLAEFQRIRKTLTGEAYSTIDTGVKTALDEIVMSLWHDLEHSGDTVNLSLRTERHEDLAVRMIVLKKLLDAKIPTAFLEEVEEELSRTRRSVATTARKTPIKSNTTTIEEETSEESKGFLGSIKGMFAGKQDNKDRLSRSPTEQDKPTKKVGVYLDSVYSASNHLAALASRFQSEGDEKEMMNAAATGKAVFLSKELSAGAVTAKVVNPEDKKAQSPDEIRKKLAGASRASGTSRFESRDLSATSTQAMPVKEELAQSPEAIRKKLERKGSRTSGVSSFQAKELSQTIPPMAEPPVKPVIKKRTPTDRKDVAQTPEEIRKKLQNRHAEPSSTGKASFGAKDIEPLGPQDVAPPRHPKKSESASPAPEEIPKGKAVFESKDLSSNPQDKK